MAAATDSKYTSSIIDVEANSNCDNPLNPDMLKAWELDANFRNHSRAIPIDSLAIETLDIAANHLETAMPTKSGVSSIKFGNKLPKCIISTQKPSLLCPERPLHLVKTRLHCKFLQHHKDSSIFEAINKSLEYFSDYDFSFIEDGAMWKGKFLHESSMCVIHIHLYCDTGSPQKSDIDETPCGSHESIEYIIEVLRILGDAKPFHEFFKRFRDYIIAQNGVNIDIDAQNKHCKTNEKDIVDSSDDNLHCFSPNDESSTSTMLPALVDFIDESDFNRLKTSISQPLFSAGSPGQQSRITTTAIDRNSSRPKLSSSISAPHLVGETDQISKSSIPNSSSMATALGKCSFSDLASQASSTVFLEGDDDQSVEIERGPFLSHISKADDERRFAPLAEELDDSVVFVSKWPGNFGAQTPDEFVQSLRPILDMALSSLFESQLEAARMLCDLSHSDCALLCDSSVIVHIGSTIESLILSTTFKVVCEQALIALACFVDSRPGYDRFFADSEILPILALLITNPKDRDNAYETAQLRRECARSLLKIVQSDASKVVYRLKRFQGEQSEHHREVVLPIPQPPRERIRHLHSIGLDSDHTVVSATAPDDNEIQTALKDDMESILLGYARSSSTSPIPLKQLGAESQFAQANMTGATKRSIFSQHPFFSNAASTGKGFKTSSSDSPLAFSPNSFILRRWLDSLESLQDPRLLALALRIRETLLRVVNKLGL